VGPGAGVDAVEKIYFPFWEQSPASSAEVKKGGAMPPLSYMSSWYVLN
jgi:hypothetical protein